MSATRSVKFPIVLRVSTQFPDQCVLSHFLEAECGDDLVDVGFLAGDQLPIDLPDAHRATLGGVIATNTSGARRYANGTMRDYVIGIRAVDGQGITYNGGGRVVKNVAGYDFCKLLTGSLGTLGIISQVTLKVKPIPPCSRFVVCRVRDWTTTERLLAELAVSPVPAGPSRGKSRR